VLAAFEQRERVFMGGFGVHAKQHGAGEGVGEQGHEA